MTERRDFIKVVVASAGALALPGVASAQNSKTLPPIIGLLLNEGQIVAPAAASATVEISIPAG